MTFRIDVFNAQRERLGIIGSASRIEVEESLDMVGTASFLMPATDENAALVQSGHYFTLIDDIDGDLGTYRYADKDITGTGELAVQLEEETIELAEDTAGFMLDFRYDLVSDVLGTVIGEYPGWSTVCYDTGWTTFSSNGASALAILDELRDLRGHWRYVGSKAIEFGAFGESSGIRLINQEGQAPPDAGKYSEIAIVPPDGITMKDDSKRIVNSIIAFGSGVNTSALTMELATKGDYDLQEYENHDGVTYYYIEDEASVLTNNRRRKILRFPQIRPLSNQPEDVAAAADWLKLTAEAYLKKRLEPRQTYQVAPINLDTSVKVGQTVELNYIRQVNSAEAGEFTWMEIDEDLMVMTIRTVRDVEVGKTVALELSSNGQHRTSDADTLVEEIRESRAYRSHVQCFPSRSTHGPYTGRLDSTTAAEFSISIGKETLFLHTARLRIKSGPLRSSVKAVASSSEQSETTYGGGNHSHMMFKLDSAMPDVTTNRRIKAATATGQGVPAYLIAHVTGAIQDFYTWTASGNHKHDYDIPAHTHEMEYGLYQDTQTPATLSLKINGLEVTDSLEGPWPGGNGTFEVDVAPYLNNAVGGLQQEHTFEISCSSGQGELLFELTTLETIQSITVEV